MPKINERTKPNSNSEIQSVLFNVKIFDENQAKKWLEENEFTGLKSDEEIEGDYLRFRQYNPEEYKRFRTIESGKKGIKFIIGFTELKKQDNQLIDFNGVRLYCKKLNYADDIIESIVYILENYEKNELSQIGGILTRMYFELEQKEYNEASQIQLVKKVLEKKDIKSVRLIKQSADNEKRLVYGVVIEPNNVDTDNEYSDEDDIEIACHKYMKFFKESGIGHEFVVEKGLDIVENYIAQSNFTVNGTMIKKGSWVMVHHVENDDIWESIKKGELTGYSLEGLGILSN